jgi:hypothetical protein
MRNYLEVYHWLGSTKNWLYFQFENSRIVTKHMTQINFRSSAKQGKLSKLDNGQEDWNYFDFTKM